MALNINGTTGISGVDGSASAPAIQGTDSNTGLSFASDTVKINTGGTTRATIDSTGALDVPTNFPIKVNGSEKLKLDSNGRVLAGNYFTSKQIGGRTSSFQIQGTDANTSSLSLFRYSADDAGSAITLGKGRASSAGGTDKLNNGDTVGSILWVGANNADLQNGNMGAIDVQADADQGGGDTPSRMRFFTVPDGTSTLTEAMRINSLGDLAIGDIANDCRLTLKQRSSNVNYLHCRNTSGTLKYYIHLSGNVYNTNGSYGQISDQSLKENIVDAKSQWNDIKNIKIRNFNFTKASGQDTHTQIGCVAQEVEKISPKLVTTPNEDGLKTVQTSVLYMKAVKALQEAMAKIEVLETKVAALEAG